MGYSGARFSICLRYRSVLSAFRKRSNVSSRREPAPQRRGTSVAANSEEAKSAYSRREFAVKNCIALKEARESAFWLKVIITCDLTRDPEAHRLLKESGELIGILTATVRTARQPPAN